ncbi:MAG: XylR family transcriptional regulator [Pirellulaceae bacterium]|jgi:LacI family transcriptional regulator|nr:XylR family transcriptional regulator [Thermoguttaceae bacterium]MDI9443520.1 XylR family transcriptional regulator [Planctomycetota bacterium]NLZ01906.1 XylR family transcriptional regulator [Pirellulaceae bacterium]
MIRPRKVALLIEWSRAYGRGVLGGIADYVRAHGTWKIYQTERRLCDGPPDWLKTWNGDGIIARIENVQLRRQIAQMDLPVVDLFEHRNRGGVPGVLTDNRAIAHLAADHLITQGLEHFAYCGLPGIYSSEERSHCFVQYLRSSGYDVSVYDNPRQAETPFISSTEDYELRCEETVARWVASLPKPVGLMACNDLRAQQVLMACADRNIAVPEELAVIGVDNDELICELCHPPLSSVEQNPQGVGYQAAGLLDKLLDGEQPPPAPILVEPLGVVPRQSTDMVAVGDADVAAAMHFIRGHACDGIRVGDVVQHVQVSRSTLERRFARLLGRSPKAEILRVQLDRVKQLLAMTDYPLAKIAQISGFDYVESMCTCFKRTTGQTPGQYRAEQEHP